MSNLKHSNKTTSQIRLGQWIWKSYLKASLVPLLIVEVALILIYIVTNAFTNHQNISLLRNLAKDELSNIANHDAAGINHKLEDINAATTYLAKETQNVLENNNQYPKDNPERFKLDPNGVYYTYIDDGGSAVFFSAIHNFSHDKKIKAINTKGLDPVLKTLKQSYPLIDQIYLNTYDSMNRIYPYFDVLNQYKSDMDIPKFNFYYEADSLHNPDRRTVWTDPYVDPAGKGWMVSCIAPVYRKDFLEGVVGSDITLKTVINDVLDLKIPWDGYGILISKKGTILAMPKNAEKDWRLKEVDLPKEQYVISQDTFKPDEYNIYNHPDFAFLRNRILNEYQGISKVNLHESKLIAWSTIPETEWKLLVTVPENNIFLAVLKHSKRLNTIAMLMVLGMLCFYVIFFWMLFKRSKAMSENISKPLIQIDQIVSSIGKGDFNVLMPHSNVIELNNTASGVVEMGFQLQEANLRRDEAEASLEERNHNLQTVLDLSPDGFVFINCAGEIVLANPIICDLIQRDLNSIVGIQEQELWNLISEFSPDKHIDYKNLDEFPITIEKPGLRYLRCKIKHVKDQSGNSVGKLLFFHDFTVDYEVDRFKNEFIKIAAHELRTPLTTILGYSELISINGLDKKNQKEAVKTILQESIKLDLIIGDIIDISRIEDRSGQNIKYEKHSLVEILNEFINSYSVPEGRQPISFNFEHDSTVWVDRDKFIQAISRVVDNAFKFSKNGPIEISTERKSIFSEDFIGVSIKDYGIGISDKDLNRVTDRFWRADTSGQYTGVGLGMAICRELIEINHGKIEIYSEINIGTTVKLFLQL